VFKKYFHFQMVTLLIAFIALSACSPQAALPLTATSEPVATPAATSEPTATPAQSGPILLRFAISDNHGEASEPYAQEFIDQVKKLSNGEILIEPHWDAGDANKAGFEGRVIELVKSGQADLGLAASRAWYGENITSFLPLQAPFLVTSNALADAIATSDVAARMLDSLSGAGLTGLTLWPEDLRHPFSSIAGKPILTPADIAGRKIRVTDSGISQKLIETLGGTPVTGDSGYEGAESGLRQARSLSGTPTATGNVTFFSKFQVLFANGTAFGKLSQAQQAIIRQAAVAAQKKAIAERPSEADAAKAWCEDVSAVVLASDEQIAAFQKAAQPVFDWIEQDPQNAELVVAIRELKDKTPPSPGAQACSPVVAGQNSTPGADSQTWSAGLPPNGIWQVTLTSDDFMKLGVSKAKAPEWAGVYTFTFQDGRFHWACVNTEGSAKGTSLSADGSYEIVNDFVRLTNGDIVDDVQWRLDDEGLHFHLLATQNDPFIENRAMFEAKPYQMVEKWSTGLPPNGVWEVTLTNEDVIKLGVSKAKAPDWSGVYTFTFQDGRFHWAWVGTEGYAKGQTASADGSYEIVNDFVRLTNGDIVDDVQWRLDDEGLHFHLLATQNDPFIENRAMFEAKPYQKVEKWSTGLPPNGVWTAEITSDDLIRMGVSKASVPDWAGVYTNTFQNGAFTTSWKNTEGPDAGKISSCTGTYAVVDDFVRITYTNGGDCFENEVDDIQWRIDDQGLMHFHLVANQNGKFTEVKATYEAKPYQKVGDK